MEERIYNQRYEQDLDGAGRKFFIYAPPPKGVRLSKRVPPQAPYSDAESYKISVYYYWWQYLRRSKLCKRTCENNGKGKLAKLYAGACDTFVCTVHCLVSHTSASSCPPCQGKMLYSVPLIPMCGQSPRNSMVFPPRQRF